MIIVVKCAWCSQRQRLVTSDEPVEHRCQHCCMLNEVKGVDEDLWLVRAKLDPDFVAWVRTQRCRLFMNDPCEPRMGVDPHHAGKKRGMGMKADDGTCIPLCRKHHRAWHDLALPFRSMTRDQRRSWSQYQIGWTQGAFAKWWKEQREQA